MRARPAIDDAQRRARLAWRHRLAPAARAANAEAVAEALVALHASDPATPHLSVVARLSTPDDGPAPIGTLGAALYERRSLLRHHGMRRTLWIAHPEVVSHYHAACTAPLAAKERANLLGWVAGSGIAEPEAWLSRSQAAVLKALHRLGPITARQLGQEVPALAARLTVGAGRSTSEQGAHTRLLLLAGFEGDAVRVAPRSWVHSEYPWAAMTDWYPPGVVGSEPVESRAALAQCYLHAFGPARPTDLQWWAGWTTSATRAALAAVGAVEVDLDGGVTGVVLPDDVDPVPDPCHDGDPWVALLPGLDPTTMGWRHRAWYLGRSPAGDLGAFGGPLFDRNGNAGSTAWVDGRVVGGWAQRPDGTIALGLLVPLDRARRARLQASAEQLAASIGAARVKPRFPAPIQADLLRP